MIRLFICLFLVVSYCAYSENTKSLPHDQNSALIIEEKIKFLDEKTNRLQLEVDKYEGRCKDNDMNLKKDIEKSKEEVKDEIYTNAQILSLIFVVITALVTIIGIKPIKKRIEKLITEKAQKLITAKLNSNEINEFIDNLIKQKFDNYDKTIKQIEDKGNSTIDTITVRAQKIMDSLLAPAAKVHIMTSNEKQSEQNIRIQDDAILANEFIEKAIQSSDPLTQIEFYKNALVLAPNSANILNNMVVVYNNLKMTDDAIKCAMEAIKLDPKLYLVYANIAESYYLKGEYADALKNIEIPIEKDPTIIYAFEIKSKILIKLGNKEAAELSLKKAIDLNPASVLAYHILGHFYLRVGEYEKSLEYSIKSLTMGNTYKSEIYNNIAVAYRKLKKFDLAIEYIEKAKDLQESNPYIDGTLALIYADKNDDENFYKYLTIALENNCRVWDYLDDTGFDKYRETKKLKVLIEVYKKKYLGK